MQRAARNLMSLVVFAAFQNGCYKYSDRSGSSDGVKLIKMDSKLTAATANADFRLMARGMADALKFLGDSKFASNISGGSNSGPNCPSGQTCPTSPPSPVNNFDHSKDADNAADWLEKHLLNDAHFDAGASTETSLLYCLNGSDACVHDNGNGGTTTDAKCQQELVAVPICVRFTAQADDALDGDLLLGKTHDLNPATFHISKTKAAVQVHIADAKASAEALMAAAGERLPSSWPAFAQGAVSASLEKKGDGLFTGLLSVDQAVQVSFGAVGDRKYYNVSLAVAPALFTVALDANKKQLSAALDAKALDAALAADILFGKAGETCDTGGSDGSGSGGSGGSNGSGSGCTTTPEKHYDGTFLAHLGGASASGTLLVNATTGDTFSVKNLGLGDDTTKVQFQPLAGVAAPLLAIDVNATSGRRFDLTVTQKGDDTQIDVVPSLKLVIAHDFSALAPQWTDLKGWMLKATSEVALSGTTPGVRFLKQSDSSSSSSSGSSGSDSTTNSTPQAMLSVVAGDLALKASGMISLSDVSVSATAGQCLFFKDAGDAHPFAGFTVGSCP